MAKIVVNILYLVVLLALAEGQHKHGGMHQPSNGKEEFEIILETKQSRSLPWTIQNSNPIVTLINDYVDPKNNNAINLANGIGYLGYTIHHKLGGVKMHTWKIPRCGRSDLERGLLQTAPQSIKNKFQNILNNALNSCPTTV